MEQLTKSDYRQMITVLREWKAVSARSEADVNDASDLMAKLSVIMNGLN